MRRRISALVLATFTVAGLMAGLPAGAQTAEQEIRIVRDTYGVPHVYGETAEDVSYGAGYALAQDRLWQMHVFRLIAKGRLSELLGPVVIDIDREVRFFTYTEEERARKFATYPQDLQRNLEAFRDGINARIAEVRSDPTLLPLEFAEFGLGLPEDWRVDDSIALSDVLILSFGSGGGNELTYAALLRQLVDAHGAETGQAMFDDLVLTTDPDSIPTVPAELDYVANDDHVREADANARRALTDDARISLGGPSIQGTAEARPTAKGTLEQLSLVPDPDKALAQIEPLQRGREMLERVFSFGSNAQIAGPQVSETDNSLQTGGPQVGYLLPQWLADFGLHAADGTLDTTGMTFAGVGPAVLIGRGTGYAWTTTTGSSDLTDTYVEQLGPDNPRTYVFDPDGNGPEEARIEPMECRNETYTLRGVPFESEEICRTRHGPVVAFDEDNGVAYSVRYSWFDREVQTAEGFFRYNEVKSLEDFATYANYLSSNHNMFYTDDQGNFGFWHPGNHVVRADGIDIRMPQDGTGGSEWQGLVPVQEVPHAVNFERGWLANWNNIPAAGWERERGHPALDNVNDLERTLDVAQTAVPDPDGGLVNAGRPCPQSHAQPECRKLDFDDLSANLRYAAFKHHRDTYFRPFLPSAEELDTDLARDALAVLEGWDGFLNDPDEDGLYHAGKSIVDAWVSRMRELTFRPVLAGLAGRADESLLWHVINPDDQLVLKADWGAGFEAATGRPASDIPAVAFEQAVAGLRDRYDSENPSWWQEAVRMQHYQRLNADLFTDIAGGMADDELSALAPNVGLFDNRADNGFAGDVRDHISMDRGTYNHVVSYQSAPSGSGVLGDVASKAGSVIPPGQNGHVWLTGAEGDHYEDQLELYEQWRYKPMPLTLGEARRVAESEIVLTR